CASHLACGSSSVLRLLLTAAFTSPAPPGAGCQGGPQCSHYGGPGGDRMAAAAFLSRMPRLAMVSATASIIPLMVAAAPAGAGRYVAINGSGTSWPSISIDQWAQAVRAPGIVGSYHPHGSAAGLVRYMAHPDHLPP